MTRFEQLECDARRCGLGVATYSPGDGKTRYAFYQLKGSKTNDYFGCKRICVFLGIRDAQTYITGFSQGYFHAQKNYFDQKEDE